MANAEDEIKLFTRAAEVRLETIPNGHHFLSASKPAEVNAAVIDFLGRWA